MRGDRVVAQDRMAGLHDVADAQGDKADSDEEADREQPVPSRDRAGRDGRGERHGEKSAERQDDESRREGEVESVQLVSPRWRHSPRMLLIGNATSL